MIGPRHQKGAAAVFAAISLTALLAAVALVVDVGSLYFAQRDLQNAASLASLDAVRVGSGCYGPAPQDPAAAVHDAARDTLSRNGHPEAWLAEPPRLGGIVAESSGERVFFAGESGLGFAAEVTLQRPMPRRLLPNLFAGNDAGGERQLRATAAAEARNNVSLSVGSFGARVSPTAPGALLSTLPGSVNIVALDYAALVDAQIGLGDLGSGSVSDVSRFLSERTELPTFLDAIADTLLATNDSVAATAVMAIQAASDASQTLVPGNLINLDSTVTPTLTGATFSAGNLVEAALQSVLVDAVFETIIELGGGREVALTLRESAQPAFGPPGLTPEGEERTEAGTAQVRVQSGLDLGDLLPTGTELTLFAESAAARAAVTGVRCPRAGQPLSEARVRTRTSVAEVGIEPVTVELSLSALRSALGISESGLGNLLGGSGSLLCNLLGGTLCNLLDQDPLLELTIAAPPVTLPGADEEEWFPGPFPETRSYSAPSSGVVADLIVGAIDVEISVAGAPPSGAVGNLLSDVLALLQPLVRGLVAEALEDTLAIAVDPLLGQLGVSMAGADVTVEGIDITRPRVVTTRRGN